MNQKSLDAAQNGEVVEPYLRKARQLHGDAFFLTGDPVILGRRKLESCTTDFCGVEFKPFHLTAFRTTSASFIPAMRESGFQHFIVLDRRNRLRKIVSSRLAARTGVWHVPAGTLRNGDRIAIDVDDFQLDRKHGTLVEVLKMYDAEFDELRRLLAPDYLDLVYREIVRLFPGMCRPRFHLQPELRHIFHDKRNSHKLGGLD